MQRVQTLARTAILPLGQQSLDPLDLARSATVLGCALALMMAGPVLPF